MNRNKHREKQQKKLYRKQPGKNGDTFCQAVFIRCGMDCLRQGAPFACGKIRKATKLLINKAETATIEAEKIAENHCSGEQRKESGMGELIAVLLDFLSTIIAWGKAFWEGDEEEHGLD